MDNADAKSTEKVSKSIIDQPNVISLSRLRKIDKKTLESKLSYCKTDQELGTLTQAYTLYKKEDLPKQCTTFSLFHRYNLDNTDSCWPRAVDSHAGKPQFNQVSNLLKIMDKKMKKGQKKLEYQISMNQGFQIRTHVPLLPI